MLAAAFSQVLSMSITASFVILAVLSASFLLRRAPKIFSYALWAVVLFRLLCPFSIPSELSIVPEAVVAGDAVASWADDYVDSVDLHYEGSQHYEAAVGAGREPIADGEGNYYVATKHDQLGEPGTVESEWFPVLGAIWVGGAACMAGYGAYSYLRLRKKLVGAVPLSKGIYLADLVETPFVVGLTNPKIYLPSSIEDRERPYVILHEQHHIRRFDHVTRALAFVALCIHWFNPLVWVAFVFSGKDMEMSCDEAVMKKMGTEVRADYSASLLGFATGRRLIAGTPLAFGEGDTRSRIENLARWKKPAVWIVAAAALACVIAVLALITNPVSKPDAKLAVFIDCEIASHHQSPYSGENFCCLDWDLIGTERNGDQTTLYMWVLYKEYSYDGELHLEAGAHMLTAITVEESDGSYRLVEYWTPEDGADYSDSIKSKVPMRLWGKAMDSQRYIDDQSAELEQLAKEHFSIDAESSVDGGESGKASNSSPASFNEAISNAILEHYRVLHHPTSGTSSLLWPDGLIRVESHILLANEAVGIPSAGQDPVETTAYLLVLYQEYSTSGGKLEARGGSCVPAAITFEVDDAGGITLKEYWEPRDGAYHVDDVRAKFPEKAADAALSNQDLVEHLKKECYAAADAQLQSEGSVDQKISGLLDEIASSARPSDSPYAQITAYEDEYDQLVAYGEFTLRYCFALFLEGGQTDLRGEVMAEVCQEIAASWGEALVMADRDRRINGQEWFDEFRDHAESLLDQHQAEIIEKHYPASWLLIQMMSYK